MQGYETTSHIVKKHGNQPSLFAYALAFAERSVTGQEKGAKYLGDLQSYFRGIKKGPDFRMEVVHTVDTWNDVSPVLWDIQDRNGATVGNLLDYLVRRRCLVKFTDWQKWVEATADKVMNYITGLCTPSTTPRSWVDAVAAYKCDNLLKKWMEGNTERYDTKVDKPQSTPSLLANL